MVKQATHKPDNIATGHPLDKAVQMADNVIRRFQDKAEVREFEAAELEAWKQCLNGMAASASGKMFLTCMVQTANIFKPPASKDTVQMVEDRIKAWFYLTWVRPHLDPQLRKEIE